MAPARSPGVQLDPRAPRPHNYEFEGALRIWGTLSPSHTRLQEGSLGSPAYRHRLQEGFLGSPAYRHRLQEGILCSIGRACEASPAYRHRLQEVFLCSPAYRHRLEEGFLGSPAYRHRLQEGFLGSPAYRHRLQEGFLGSLGWACDASPAYSRLITGQPSLQAAHTGGLPGQPWTGPRGQSWL